MVQLPKLAREDWASNQLAGKVPNTRLVNGKDLSSDVTLTAADVGADAAGTAASLLAPPAQVAWVHWGDSMVSEGSAGWGSLWAAFDGLPHADMGIGGQWPEHVVARQGGRSPLVMVVGGNIPASGPVSVSAVRNAPLNADGSVAGTLAGVDGTLTRVGSAWSFVRTASGSVTPVAPGTPFLLNDSLTYRSHRMVLEAANGAKYSTDPLNDFVRPFRAALDFSQSLKMVLDAAPSDDIPLPAGAGSAREKFDATNTALSQAFPAELFPVFAQLRTAGAFSACGALATSKDTADMTAGVTPSSFRKDTIHLNALGARAAAYLIAAEAYRRGFSHANPTLQTLSYTNLMPVPAPSQTATANWTGWGGTALPITNAAGAYTEESVNWSPTGDCIRLVGAAGATTLSHVNVTVGGVNTRPAVTVGTSYAASIYSKCSKDLTVRLRVRWYKGSVDGFATISDTFSQDILLNAGKVNWISVVGEAPVGAVHAMISVVGVAGTLADGSTLEVAAPMLHAGTVALPCRTGASPGWAWSGTAWESPSSGNITAWLGT